MGYPFTVALSVIISCYSSNPVINNKIPYLILTSEIIVTNPKHFCRDRFSVTDLSRASGSVRLTSKI